MATYKKSFATREKILQTASKLFFEKGYNSTTIRDIAGAAELSLSRLNYHFNSKALLAEEICREFLRNLNEELFESLPAMEEKIVRDTVHIRTWIRIFLSNNKAMNFYYELACADILNRAIIESDYRHFVEQATYLNIQVDLMRLRMYAHVFTASFIGLIKAKKEGDITSSKDEIIDMCNAIHLNLLGMNALQQKKIVAQAKVHAARIQYQLKDLSSIRIVYQR
ncbi:MAG: TetR/AcrR family transcriptional regulator [Desulfopila sp.]